MIKRLFFMLIMLFFTINTLVAQCSMCTKTAQQLGEKPAQGLNAGILYLMLAPFAIMGFVLYKWWKNEKKNAV